MHESEIKPRRISNKVYVQQILMALYQRTARNDPAYW